MQELRANTNFISGETQFAWYQDGVAQYQGYVPRGSKLLRNSGPYPTIADDLAATYDPAAGTLTWVTPPAYGAAQVWTRIGSLPRLPAQELAFQPGHGNSVFYLLLEGGASALASRGPGHHASCVAKLQLDPSASVSHMAIQRAHRFVEVAPQSLSHVTFFIRTADGSIVDLKSLGASISFTLTVASRDGG